MSDVDNEVSGKSTLDLSTPKGRELFLENFLFGQGYSPLAVAVLMAQAKVETDEYRTMREYGGVAYLSKYDFRQDLGNNGHGMGAKYCGRGYIQITGYNNYAKVSKKLNIDFVNQPELAEKPETAVLVFDWFIHEGNKYRNGDNVLACASRGEIDRASKLVNGGTNGLIRRRKYFEEYRRKYRV